MTREEIEKTAFEQIKCCDELNLGAILEGVGRESFIQGTDWRIRAIWRKPNEEPVKKTNLLLIEANDGEFSLDYTFDPATTKLWSYIKDLMPEE